MKPINEKTKFIDDKGTVSNKNETGRLIHTEKSLILDKGTLNDIKKNKENDVNDNNEFIEENKNSQPNDHKNYQIKNSKEISDKEYKKNKEPNIIINCIIIKKDVNKLLHPNSLYKKYDYIINFLFKVENTITKLITSINEKIKKRYVIFDGEKNLPNCYLLNTKYNVREMENFINGQITKIKKSNGFIEFKSFGMYKDEEFHPYLLDDFIIFKISELDFFIRENKELILLIDTNPYVLKKPLIKYYLNKCKQCLTKTIVFKGCNSCELFFCSVECKKINFAQHILKNQKCCISFLFEENKRLSKSLKKINFETKQDFPIVGLKNLGNSCYLNAVLQILFSIDEIKNFFSTEITEDIINQNKSKDKEKILFLSFKNIILNILTIKNYSLFKPGIFKYLLDSNFAEDKQQDASEFFLYLINNLHDFLNVNKNEDKDKNNELFEINCNNVADEEWNLFLNKNKSIIVDLFYGQMASFVKCPNCNNETYNYLVFNTIEIPINDKKENSTLNIKSCLDEYFKNESLDKNNLYDCEKCKKKVNSIKKLTITKIPEILILILKKYTYYNDMQSKKNIIVDFPVYSLDINPYLSKIREKEKVYYNLFGVINHEGKNFFEGHYTCICKYQNFWYLFNDSHITRIRYNYIEKKTTLFDNSYILFYRRVNNNNEIDKDIKNNEKLDGVMDNNPKKEYEEKEQNSDISCHSEVSDDSDERKGNSFISNNSVSNSEIIDSFGEKRDQKDNKEKKEKQLAETFDDLDISEKKSQKKELVINFKVSI